MTLLTHVHGVAGDVPARETADADMAVSLEVIGDPRLPQALAAAGYTAEASNRFVRESLGRRLVIDLLAPSYQDRLLTNQPHGTLVVDEVPGLLTALALPATPIVAAAVLSDGADITISLDLPDVRGALILKAYAYTGRLSARDAQDIWRLLAAAHAAGHSAEDWPTTSEGSFAAEILHERFARRAAKGPGRATSEPADQAKIRLLAARITKRPPAPPAGRMPGAETS